jgi:hypothetical protein
MCPLAVKNVVLKILFIFIPQRHRLADKEERGRTKNKKRGRRNEGGASD